MSWWQTLIVALSTLIVTKFIDVIISIVNEKRAFKKHRREKAFAEIEDLKNEVGVIVELAASWKGYDNKQSDYINKFANDHELVGKYNKYKPIANAARDTVHWCKIVASDEMHNTNELNENKRELQVKFEIFITKCDEQIENLV